MSTIDNTTFASLREAAELAISCRDVRFMFVGEPGIGKTSQVGYMQEVTGMDAAILSVPDMDVGDIAMPVIDHDTRTTRYYPNARFKLQDGKPLIICLDEYTKGHDPVKNMLHPMFETFRPRLGDLMIPEGSIIFLTGNLASDGVGDAMQAHTRGRLTVVPVRKPGNEEWIRDFASPRGLEPVIIAWASQHAHAFASYTDGDQNGNELIFNPHKVQDGYVCPRTLENASRIIKRRENFSYNALACALAGVVGKPAAESITSFIRHNDQLPAWRDIIEAPTKTPIPKDQGALAVLVYGAIERVTSKDMLDAFLDYIVRADEEWQSIFCLGMARNKAKQSIAFGSKRFAKWISDNEDLL